MNFSTEELQEILSILGKNDLQSYCSAKKLLSEFDKELQKIKPFLKLTSHQASYSRRNPTIKNTVERCQRYLKIIDAINSISTNLPEEFKGTQKPMSEYIPPLNPMFSTTRGNQRKNEIIRTRIPQPGVTCVMAGCCEQRVTGSDYCYKHEALAVRLSGKNGTCVYPACKARRYAGSLYCYYHYQQEKYLSK